MRTDDLFTKIGILTVENDMLRAELNQARERIEQLEKALMPAPPDMVEPEVLPKEK